MELRSRILLVHSVPERADKLLQALGEGVILAADAASALHQLSAGETDLLITEDGVDAGFLEEVARRSPRTRRVVLLNGGDREPWLEAAAEGHRFLAFPEQLPDLPVRLRDLVRGEPARAKGLSGCTVQVSAGGGRAVVTGSLLRLTSESITFRLEPGDSLESFLPGCELESVSVRRGRETVLEGCVASVAEIRPDPTAGFEVRMTLGPPPAPSPAEEVVRDAMQCASLVGEALRRRRLLVEAAEGASDRVVVRGSVDALAGLLLLEPLPKGLGPGVPLRFSFSAGGAHYQFVSALAPPPSPARGPSMSAPLPPELRGRRRRRARLVLAAGEATAEFTPLLASKAICRPVVDVEMEGMGFLSEPADLLPMGTRLKDLRVSLGQGMELRASGRIVSRAPLAANGNTAIRQGVRFDPLAPEEQAALAAATLRHAHRGLELARDLSFDAVWSFMRETGFLYPEKEAKIRPNLSEVRRTLGILLARPDGPLRTLLFRSDGLIAGHVSAARIYRATWMVQHLAVQKEGSGRLAAAPALNVGVVDYLEQLPDCEWGRIWFRPENRWPSRTFGRFARLQFDPHRCDLRTYAYLVALAARGLAPDGIRGVEIAPAGPADWAEFRRHLAGTGQTAMLSAEDLCSAPDLTEAGEPFRALGLERRREGLVARRHGRLAAFALLEISSLGINLSELTNAFRLYALDPDPGVTAALAAAARDRYAELGRSMAIGLAEAPDAAAWKAAGFEQVKSYTCLTWHRSMIRRYVEFVQRLHECLASRALRRPS